VTKSGRLLQLSAVSHCRVGLLLTFNMIPRLGIALVLGIIGVHFLASTTSVSDLILNAVALEVVLCIDDLFFAVLVPRRVHETIKSLQPIPVKLWRPWVLQARQAFIFVLSLASLIAAHIVYLQPIVNSMQMTADAMCSGATNFTFFQDAAGVAYILKHEPVAVSREGSYVYRAVLQATQLEAVEPPGLSAQVMNPELVGLAMQLKGLDFESRNKFWPLCQDFDSPIYAGFGLLNLGTAALENLRGLVPEADLASCSSLRPFCFNSSLPFETLWRLRALCPVACGCGDVQSGSFVASLPSFGCPQVCRPLFEKSVNGLPCSDAEPGNEMLETFLYSLSRRRGVAGNFTMTCHDFAGPITIDGTNFDFCTQTAELGRMGFQSSQLVCPVTCGCQDSPRPECPMQCSGSVA